MVAESLPSTRSLSTPYGQLHTSGRRGGLRLLGPDVHPVGASVPVHYERYSLETPDGFSLGLFRSRATACASSMSAARPVLLLHGVGANRFGFGLSDDANLPRFLNAHGRDVWMLEFRGNRSATDLLARRAPPIDLDHKLDVDLPTAVAHILADTGADALDLVGHSMGGLLTYLYLGRNPAAPIGRAVTLCAPSGLGHMVPKLSRALLRRPAASVRPLLDRLSGLGIDSISKTRGPLGHLFMWRQHSRLGNLDVHERRLFMDHAVEDMVGSYAGQLMQWAVEGQMTSRAGERYDDAISRVRHPIRVIACHGDKIIPPSVVERGFLALGSDERDYHVIGKRHGSTKNYGHMDLLMARSAWRDVYGLVGSWLEPSAI